MGDHGSDIDNVKGRIDSDVVDVGTSRSEKCRIFFTHDSIPQNAHDRTLSGLGRLVSGLER
jgi:hypothetical protein